MCGWRCEIKNLLKRVGQYLTSRECDFCCITWKKCGNKCGNTTNIYITSNSNVAWLCYHGFVFCPWYRYLTKSPGINLLWNVELLQFFLSLFFFTFIRWYSQDSGASRDSRLNSLGGPNPAPFVLAAFGLCLWIHPSNLSCIIYFCI